MRKRLLLEDPTTGLRGWAFFVSEVPPYQPFLESGLASWAFWVELQIRSSFARCNHFTGVLSFAHACKCNPPHM